MLNIQFLVIYIQFLTIEDVFVIFLVDKVLLIKNIGNLHFKIDVKHLII